MKTFRLKYINSYEDNRGKVRYYFRRSGGKNIPLPSDPNSREFRIAYEAAMGDTPRADSHRALPFTFDVLIESWYRTSDYGKLAQSTKATYKGIIERWRKDNGSKRVAHLEAKHIRVMMNDRQATPSAGNGMLTMLKLLLRHATELDWIKTDPTIGVRKLKESEIGFYSWTETDIRKFKDTHALGTMPRLAMELMLCTAQRRSDAVKLGRQHVRDGTISVVQQKTGARLAIPVHPDLQAAIDSVKTGHMTFLITGFGKPFQVAGFGNWFRDKCNAAGLPQCTSHGLRKATSRRLAEAGCTPHQIASLTGHRSLREVERYTREADQGRLAIEAVAILKKKAGTPAKDGQL